METHAVSSYSLEAPKDINHFISLIVSLLKLKCSQEFFLTYTKQLRFLVFFFFFDL